MVAKEWARFLFLTRRKHKRYVFEEEKTRKRAKSGPYFSFFTSLSFPFSAQIKTPAVSLPLSHKSPFSKIEAKFLACVCAIKGLFFAPFPSRTLNKKTCVILRCFEQNRKQVVQIFARSSPFYFFTPLYIYSHVLIFTPPPPPLKSN